MMGAEELIKSRIVFIGAAIEVHRALAPGLLEVLQNPGYVKTDNGYGE